MGVAGQCSPLWLQVPDQVSLWSLVLGFGVHWLPWVLTRPGWKGNFPIAGNVVWLRQTCNVEGREHGPPEQKTFIMESVLLGKQKMLKQYKMTTFFF